MQRIRFIVLQVVKKEGSGFKGAREEALYAIKRITCNGDADVKKGLYDFPGLIPCLVSVLGKEGDEWKGSKLRAIWAIENISKSGVKLSKGVYETPGVMEGLERAKEDRVVDYRANCCGTDAISAITEHKTSAWRLPSEGASADATSTTTINPDDNELS